MFSIVTSYHLACQLDFSPVPLLCHPERLNVGQAFSLTEALAGYKPALRKNQRDSLSRVSFNVGARGFASSPLWGNFRLRLKQETLLREPHFLSGREDLHRPPNGETSAYDKQKDST